MLEVAKGIWYIHSEGVVHGDLHGVGSLASQPLPMTHSHLIFYQKNILLDSTLCCQITDFGLTRHSDTSIQQSTKTFLPSFAAPELLGLCTKCFQYDCDGCESDKPKTNKTMETDVYAFGSLYYSVRLNCSLSALGG